MFYFLEKKTISTNGRRFVKEISLTILVMIKENIDCIKSNIDLINKKENNDVKLIAVSKTVDVDKIEKAIDCGQLIFGENRVQEIVRKYDYFSNKREIEWHMIGYLQTNKVKQIIDKVSMIHSLDRIKLAKEIEKQAAKIDRVIPCLIEVNVGEEDSKAGISINEVIPFIEQLMQFEHIKINGLMTVAPYNENIEEIRWVFKSLKDLFNEIEEKNFENVEMKELSMGMSNDYKIAIEEGSTMVRVGTSIFGKRDYAIK